MTGILLQIDSLRSLKEAKAMDTILGKCKLQNSFFLFSVTYVVNTHSNCHIEAIPTVA